MNTMTFVVSQMDQTAIDRTMQFRRPHIVSDSPSPGNRYALPWQPLLSIASLGRFFRRRLVQSPSESSDKIFVASHAADNVSSICPHVGLVVTHTWLSYDCAVVIGVTIFIVILLLSLLWLLLVGLVGLSENSPPHMVTITVWINSLQW